METRVNVPLRTGGKKMRKRKELDALGKRGPGNKRGTGGGVSSQDQLLSESTDEQDDFWSSTTKGRTDSGSRRSFMAKRRACWSLLRACTLALVFACVVATTTVMWLFIDVREQAAFLRNELDQGRNCIIPNNVCVVRACVRECASNLTNKFVGYCLTDLNDHNSDFLFNFPLSIRFLSNLIGTHIDIYNK